MDNDLKRVEWDMMMIMITRPQHTHIMLCDSSLLG